MIDILKPVLKKSYRTFIIPSCLPEYSECYDCVSVDDLCVSLDFVKDIFLEQNINAKRVHVVGSLEWEESPPQEVTLPESAQQLLQSSSFVLGVVHQPIFVTMHQQALYNQLTMNFQDIYERFLDNHPTASILIKPHPSDNLSALKKYFNGMKRVEILPAATHALHFYNAIDAAISMHSTMVNHTMAHGIPVVSMYQYPDYRKMYNHMEKVGGCLVTDSNDEALAWLGKMQNDPVFYTDVKAKMAKFKEQCLSIPASEKVMQLLN